MHAETETVTPLELVPASTFDLVFEGIGSGESVLTACTSAGISKSSFYRWVSSDSDLANRYALAVAAQIHARFVRS